MCFVFKHNICRGYEQAKEVGDEIGLQVFFGWEETFDGQDFLIYGLDKEWMLKHPEMEHWTIKEQFEAVDKARGWNTGISTEKMICDKYSGITCLMIFNRL